MTRRNHTRTLLGIEELDNRISPAQLAPIEVPGPEEGVGDHAQVRHVQSAAVNSHARPFRLAESGAAVFNPDGTIGGRATGQATHLGAFTLNDTSRIVGQEVIAGELILHIESDPDLDADLEAANGDHLYASFTGTINLTTGTGTLNFEWTGGTGRFADATGTTVWQFSLNPDLAYTAAANGVISY